MDVIQELEREVAMNVIINPGSGALTEGTIEQAWDNARLFFSAMQEDHIWDMILVGEPESDGKGRWKFTFEHSVTKVQKVLDVHGLNYETQKEDYLFWPRTYWDGSSCSTPKVQDFLAPGFRIAIVPVQ